MSVAGLFNIPKTRKEWEYWLFDNADEHRQIIAAINAQNKGTVQSFVLDPAPQQDTQNLLLRHQVMHNEMDNVLGIGGNDYTSLNFEDPKVTDYLWQQHANEHILARQKLGI